MLLPLMLGVREEVLIDEKKFVDTTTLVICEILESGKMGRDAKGRRPIKGRFLKTKDIREIVQHTWDASWRTPKWGSRWSTTLKHLGAFYGESGLDKRAINRGNTNKSMDRGHAQINTIHDRSYKLFCHSNDYKFQSVECDCHFASHINQLPGWSYRYLYTEREDQVYFYTELKKRVYKEMKWK